MIQYVLLCILLFVMAIWIAGRILDRTVLTPIDALDAIIEHLLR